MKIKVINNIDDPFLKEEWERLETETDVFPQSTYHWCATWWKHLAGRRKLHVVMVLDEDGKALGIAPLFIERHFGIAIIHSFPVHFSDFYTFILMRRGAMQEIMGAIIDYLLSNRLWQWVLLEQVVENDIFAQYLIERKFLRKRMTGVVTVDLSGLDWDKYLLSLNINFRRNIRNRMRKINAQFNPTLCIISDWHKFEHIFEGMVHMHNRRWQDDVVPSKGSIELKCWKEAMRKQFDKCYMVYYQLEFDGKPVAYRLSFIKDGIYYDWHIGFDPEYQKYHVGQMIMAFIIIHLFEKGISKINFMAGEYDWKLDWSPTRKSYSICQFSSPSNNIAALVLNTYHHYLRDKLKIIYHRLMEFKILRALSRKTILLKQKISGLR